MADTDIEERSGASPTFSPEEMQRLGIRPIESPRVGATFTPEQMERLGIKPVEEGFGASMKAMGETALGQFIESSPMVAGGMAGFKAAPAIGPWTPYSKAAGTVIGAGVGAVAGAKAREGLGLRRADELPPHLRSWGYGGEVVGGSIPFSFAPYAGALHGTRFDVAYPGARLLNRIIESARSTPGKFALTEGALTGLAALGGGVASEVAPGSTGARIGGEMLGTLSPGFLLARHGSKALREASSFLQRTMSEEGRQNAAARRLREILEESGEDVDELIAKLEVEELPGVSRTSAMKAGSPALAAVERVLARDPTFKGEQRKMAQQSLKAVEELTRAMKATGDPAMLREAAKIKERVWSNALAVRLAQAEKRAQEATKDIGLNTPRDWVDISRAYHKELRQAILDARKVEDEVWGAVDRSPPLRATNLATKYNQLQKEMLPEETLPRVVENFMKRTTEGTTDGRFMIVPRGTPNQLYRTNVGELIDMRSELLAQGRAAASAGKWDDARRFNELASSVMDDLGEAATPGSTLDEARRYSNSMHDVFTRTFAGDALERDPTGAFAVTPEYLLEHSFRGGGSMAAIRAEQMGEAMAFTEQAAQRYGVPRAAGAGERARQSEERALRLMAKELVDPATGRVDPAELANFAYKNELWLDRFPNVRRNLETAEGRERFVKELEETQSKARQIAEREATFGRLLGAENPARVIGEALLSPNPMKHMEGIVKLAKKGGNDALKGMSSAALDYAERRATTDTGAFNFHKYHAALDTPIDTGKPSLREVLVDSGALTKEQSDHLQTLLQESEKIEGALLSGLSVEELIDAPQALVDFALRVAGANLASGAAISHASPLIVAAAGSKLMRTAFDKVPRAKIGEVFKEAAKNPDFMAALLKRPQTEWERIQNARQINGFLWNAGLIEPFKDDEREPVSPTPPVPE